MQKRVFSLFIAIALCILAIPLSTFADAVSIEAGNDMLNTAGKTTGVDTQPFAGDVTLMDSVSIPTEEDVYNRIISMQSEYPEGMQWTNENKYRGSGGCYAFALLLRDIAFENLPTRELEEFNYEDIKVGDMLRINNDTHSVVVLELHSDYVVITEGNYNSSIHWMRRLSKQTVLDADYVLTSYPESTRVIIWMDGDGTYLDRKIYQDGQTEPVTVKIPTKESGDYTFTGWDGGTTKGNVKTYTPKFTPVSGPSNEQVLSTYVSTGRAVETVSNCYIYDWDSTRPDIQTFVATDVIWYERCLSRQNTHITIAAGHLWRMIALYTRKAAIPAQQGNLWTKNVQKLPCAEKLR